MPERVVVLVALGLIGTAFADGDDVEVRVLGDWYVPLELVQAIEREVVDAQYSRHHDEIARGALELGLLRRGVHLGRGNHDLTLYPALIQWHISRHLTLTELRAHPLGLALLLLEHAVVGPIEIYTVAERNGALRVRYQARLAVNIDMQRVDAVLAAQPPVGFDRIRRPLYPHVLIEQHGRHIEAQIRHREVIIADEHEDESFRLAHRVALHLALADDRRVGAGDNVAQHAAVPLVGKAVIPAGDGVARVALDLVREAHATVNAAVLDAVHRTVHALEQNVLPQQLDRHHYVFGYLPAEADRVPVITEAELRRQVVPPAGYALQEFLVDETLIPVHLHRVFLQLMGA